MLRKEYHRIIAPSHMPPATHCTELELIRGDRLSLNSLLVGGVLAWFSRCIWQHRVAEAAHHDRMRKDEVDSGYLKIYSCTISSERFPARSSSSFYCHFEFFMILVPKGRLVFRFPAATASPLVTGLFGSSFSLTSRLFAIVLLVGLRGSSAVFGLLSTSISPNGFAL